MFYLVYQITNRINGKIYVGVHKTSNIDDGYMGSGRMIKAAIAKYGVENFSKEILIQCNSLEEMLSKEAEIVNKDFVAREDTYNIALGGDGGFYHINSKLTPEFIRIRKELAVRRYKESVSEERRIEIGKKAYSIIREKYPKGIWKDRKHREETKKKIGEANSISNLGERNSNYGNVWITNGTKNLRHPKDEPYPEGFYKGRVNATQKQNKP